MISPSAPARLSSLAQVRRLIGGLLAVSLLLGLAELYLRYFPPSDLHPFLGDDAPLRGPFVADPDFGAAYRSWDAFRDDNSHTMTHYRHMLLAGSAARPTWLILGNSFGFELFAHLRRERPDQPVLTLDRREPLVVRLAQIRTLLDNGLRPGRILLVLTSVDFVELGKQPLATHSVNRHGGRTFAPRLPGGPTDRLLESSRVAFTAWARLGLHRGRPSFRPRHLTRTLDASLKQDIEHLFLALGDVQRRHPEVAITPILVPMRREVVSRRGFALEDAVLAALDKAGLDAFHPRAAFLDHPQPETLYIPDGHLSEAGNRLLAEGLAVHPNGRTGPRGPEVSRR